MAMIDSEQLLEQIHWIKVSVKGASADYMMGYNAGISQIESLVSFLKNQSCKSCKHVDVMKDSDGYIVGLDCRLENCRYEQRRCRRNKS
jgi:hypothetical protein